MASHYNEDWHDDNCVRMEGYTKKDGIKHFFCKTHNQWAAEYPIETRVTYTYNDGTKQTRIIKRKFEGKV